ncbi:MAG TPA: nitronate monooxygenase, partial [Ferruginibacter sp.]|nr:nitronate monooxygenase [Ferruginibacter sp.]
TTSFVLIPAVCEKVQIPVIAAGGIATGRQMLAAIILGASAVQIGSRFVASNEASSHINFKNAVINASEGDTILSLKQLTPVRLLKNEFYKKVQEAENNCAGKEILESLLGKGRSKKGMFEGNLEDGELEIGQVSALLNQIQPAAEIVEEIWDEYNRLSTFYNK